MARADFLTFIIDDSHLDARQCNLRTSRLGCGNTRQRRDHDCTGLGLPPGVHDWSLVATDYLAVPHPRLWVDWLTNAAEHSNRAQVIVGGDTATDLHKASNRGRCGVENVDVVFLNDVPPSAPVRGVRSPLIDNLRGTIGQWAVGNIGVTGDPAHVCGAPVNILTFVKVKDVFVSVGSLG